MATWKGGLNVSSTRDCIRCVKLRRLSRKWANTSSHALQPDSPGIILQTSDPRRVLPSMREVGPWNYRSQLDKGQKIRANFLTANPA